MMKTILTISFLLLLVAGAAFAGEQPEPGPWKVDVSTGVVTTQSAYSDNWTGGEAGCK